MSVRSLPGWSEAVETVTCHYAGDHWSSTDLFDAEELLDDVVTPLIAAKLNTLADAWEAAWMQIELTPGPTRGALIGAIQSLRNAAEGV